MKTAVISPLRFAFLVALVLCPLTFYAVWAFGPFGSLLIMAVPAAFALYFPRPD
ncbi:MAG TPA: hypothetical protein VFB80_19525 [Pirellulaceae bacterium]|nr:hypothetical protein [Pirellulaceae bacterium]